MTQKNCHLSLSLSLSLSHTHSLSLSLPLSLSLFLSFSLSLLSLLSMQTSKLRRVKWPQKPAWNLNNADSRENRNPPPLPLYSPYTISVYDWKSDFYSAPKCDVTCVLQTNIHTRETLNEEALKYDVISYIGGEGVGRVATERTERWEGGGGGGQIFPKFAGHHLWMFS
jgi:hypothetical protein